VKRWYTIRVRRMPRMMRPSQVLFIVLLLFVGLTVSSKDGLDRWIYGALTIATLAALIHYRQIPALSGWRV
jgi:hypothetical protein